MYMIIFDSNLMFIQAFHWVLICVMLRCCIIAFKSKNHLLWWIFFFNFWANNNYYSVSDWENNIVIIKRCPLFICLKMYI